MTVSEKGLLLIYLAPIFDKLGLESSTTYLGGLQSCTWTPNQTTGRLELAANVSFDMGANSAGPVFSVHLMISSVTETFNERVAEIPSNIDGLSNYDIYKISNLEISLDD